MISEKNSKKNGKILQNFAYEDDISRLFGIDKDVFCVFFRSPTIRLMRKFRTVRFKASYRESNLRKDE